MPDPRRRGSPSLRAGPGRPKGSRNPSEKVRDYFRRLLESVTYQKAFEDALAARKVHPSVEVMAYYYAYGKPRDTLDVGGDINVRIIHEFADPKPAGG